MLKNQAITSKTVNAKLFEGKMHTPGQCKTISNGLFRPKTQKQQVQVWASDLQLKNALN
jgi:hypothetical protein